MQKKQEKNKIEKQINEQEVLQKKKDEYKQTIEKNKEIQKLIQIEITELEKETQTQEEEKAKIETILNKYSYDELLKIESYNNQCIIIQRDIGNTINEFKILQREVE
jgi:hypothetical protein